MRADVVPGEDATSLYLRWEIVTEGKEPALLENLGGPVVLRLSARDYIDTSGKHHEASVVEIPIYPHPGARNFGQARFGSFEARRLFWESLQSAVLGRVTDFVHETSPGQVDLEGHAIEAAETPPLERA